MIEGDDVKIQYIGGTDGRYMTMHPATELIEQELYTIQFTRLKLVIALLSYDRIVIYISVL